MCSIHRVDFNQGCNTGQIFGHALRKMSLSYVPLICNKKMRDIFVKLFCEAFLQPTGLACFGMLYPRNGIFLKLVWIETRLVMIYAIYYAVIEIYVICEFGFSRLPRCFIILIIHPLYLVTGLSLILCSIQKMSFLDFLFTPFFILLIVG